MVKIRIKNDPMLLFGNTPYSHIMLSGKAGPRQQWSHYL